VRSADRIVGAGALALLAALFLFKWYGGSATSSSGDVSVGASLNGWHSFLNSRWVWLATIVVAFAHVAIGAGLIRSRSSVAPGAAVAVLGALSTLLIAYRIAHHPSGSASGTIGGLRYSASYGIKIGIWLGLLAAIGITIGGLLSLREGLRANGETAPPRAG
jgi:hypothetical protein